MTNEVDTESDTKQDNQTIATFRCRLKADKDGKDYFFAGGKKESTIVDLSKCVVFVFEEVDYEGNPIQKVVLREGAKHKTT